MKYYFLAVVLSATCVFGQPQGHVDVRPYFRGDIGPAITEDADADFFPVVGSVTLELDPGVRLSAAGGVLFSDIFALEMETGWIINSIDSISGFTDVDGYIIQVPFLVNAMAQFKNPSGVTPFIGAGVGGSFSGIDLDDADAPAFELDGNAGDAVFAWQAFAGLKFEIQENLSVGIVYRYFWSDDAEWEVEDTAQDIEFEGARSHSISAMVMLSF